MNVYKFSDSVRSKIIVAPNVATASMHVDFDWTDIKCIYKNVIVVD